MSHPDDRMYFVRTKFGLYAYMSHPHPVLTVAQEEAQSLREHGVDAEVWEASPWYPNPRTEKTDGT